ncbi:MAG: hypothetical protein ACYDCN_09465 [Bacteroidia bacterium]
MSRKLFVFITLVIVFSSCKRYYNCNCTSMVLVQTNTSTTAPTYSTAVTTYTVYIDGTLSTINGQCGALGGTNGFTTIICNIH